MNKRFTTDFTGFSSVYIYVSDGNFRFLLRYLNQHNNVASSLSVRRDCCEHFMRQFGHDI